MPSLEAILHEVGNELKTKEKIREEAQRNMRKATRLSKLAILLVHQKKTTEARKLIENAKETVSKLKRTAEAYPEIIYGGLFNAACQEYSEANIFLTLVNETEFITHKEIEMQPADYILGLADVIGECRRSALDALREGNIVESENWLRIMDEIFVQLIAMDEAHVLVQGLRRKCDVNRKIIETTRGDITLELRRATLEKHMSQLEKLVRKKT